MINIAYLTLSGECLEQKTIEAPSDDIWFYIEMERLPNSHLFENNIIKDSDDQRVPIVRMYKTSDTIQVFSYRPFILNATYKIIPRVPKGNIKIKGDMLYER